MRYLLLPLLLALSGCYYPYPPYETYYGYGAYPYPSYPYSGYVPGYYSARPPAPYAVAWIARDNQAAARGLRDAAVRAAKRIGTNPFIGATRPRLGADRFRFLLLIGYPYVVVYTADTDPPRVLRVLHSSRDLPRILAGLDP